MAIFLNKLLQEKQNNMPKNNRKSSRVSIANIIAIVGLVGVMFSTFAGHSFKSGGEWGWDILTAVGITAATAFLLWCTIKAKGADSQLDKWKMVERCALVAYVGFAILSSLFGGMAHFFTVNGQKTEMKALAADDLERIDHFYQTDYRAQAEEAIAQTRTGLEAAFVADSSSWDTSLYAFLEAQGIHCKQDIENYIAIQSDRLFLRYDELYPAFTQNRSNIENAVKSWSLLQIPGKANEIELLATTAESELGKMAKETQLPVVSKNTLGQFRVEKFQTIELPDISSQLKFKTQMQGNGDFSIPALLFPVLWHGLILFNYWATRRTRRLGISKVVEEDGGQTLS